MRVLKVNFDFSSSSVFFSWASFKELIFGLSVVKSNLQQFFPNTQNNIENKNEKITRFTRNKTA